MKIFLLAIMQLFIASGSVGQSFFEAEGKKIKTGTIQRNYNFEYRFGDTLLLALADSSTVYANRQRTVVKTVSYSRYDNDKQPEIRIEYFSADGRDSVSKLFNGNAPDMTYLRRYDRMGRVIYYGMKDFRAEPTYDRGFERFYEYRDSLISSGKIEIQTIYIDDAHGDKRFHFRVFNEYNNRNKKVKEVRGNRMDDPLAQVLTYDYNERDSLISMKVYGAETLPTRNNVHSKCYTRKDYLFAETDYKAVRSLTHRLLLENKRELILDECESYLLILTAPVMKTQLSLVKRRPYRHGMYICFTTTREL